MGFITTGGPAVLGHAWNFSSVAAHHSLLETVPGVVPPKILLSEITLSKMYEIPKEPMRAPIMYLALPPDAIFF